MWLRIYFYLLGEFDGRILKEFPMSTEKGSRYQDCSTSLVEEAAEWPRLRPKNQEKTQACKGLCKTRPIARDSIEAIALVMNLK
jgi:hypothetical protein